MSINIKKYVIVCILFKGIDFCIQIICLCFCLLLKHGHSFEAIHTKSSHGGAVRPLAGHRSVKPLPISAAPIGYQMSQQRCKRLPRLRVIVKRLQRGLKGLRHGRHIGLQKKPKGLEGAGRAPRSRRAPTARRAPATPNRPVEPQCPLHN